MAISKGRIKGVLDKTRVKDVVKAKVRNALKPAIKAAKATQMDVSVSQVNDSDFSIELEDAVGYVMKTMGFVTDAIIDEMKELVDGIINEIKTNAEISATVTVPAENLGEVTVLPATFSQGAGAAAVPNPVPVKVKINKIAIPKGKIK